MSNYGAGIEILGEVSPAHAEILTPEAVAFVADLQRNFNARRLELLQARHVRQADFDAGKTPSFLPPSQATTSEWYVASTPDDLQDRRVEITGPTDRKMMINALNCGAKVFMADLEDANSPGWLNMLEGQINLRDAVRREIRLVDEAKGKTYELAEKTATLLVRPRGWHLNERHVKIDGEVMSGSLFDFGLYMFHNAAELLRRGSGPYFYLPKLESHLEARLWNDVFIRAQEKLGIPQGSVRATVLIETILASFEMEEMLYELREHSAGFNAGRWDYIFSFIKKFSSRADLVLPERAQITMTVPFMRAYTERLVQICHRHGAHAIGGMSAFIPSRRDAEVNANAFSKVKADKEREANDGFDGSWIAHPDLREVAQEAFDAVLGERPNQKDKQRPEVQVSEADLLNTNIEGASVSEAGFRLNVNVALQYINSWLQGNGAAAINNLMEDAATAEISRAQLWQWIKNQAQLDDGRSIDAAMYEHVRDEELASLGGKDAERYGEAVEILDSLVLSDTFKEFLTVPAYSYLD